MTDGLHWFRCLDAPNCGVPFRAYDGASLCPMCGEQAERLVVA